MYRVFTARGVRVSRLRRRLTKYIRLTDFVVRDTMLNLALDSVSAMDKWINPNVSDAPFIRYKEETSASAVTSLLLMKSSAPKAEARRHVPMFRVEAGFSADPSVFAEEEARQRREVYRKAKQEVEAAARAKAAAGGGKKQRSADDGEGDDSEEEEEDADDGTAALAALANDEDRLNYDAIQLTVFPQGNLLRQKVNDLIIDAIVVVSAPPSLLKHPDLSPYTQVRLPLCRRVRGRHLRAW